MKHVRAISKAPERAQDNTPVLIIGLIIDILTALETFFTGKFAG